MENSPVDFKILNNFNFQDCYSLKEFVLPMSNKVVYEGAVYLGSNWSANRFVFHTQEDGTPYTANWSNSSTWDLTSLGCSNKSEDFASTPYFSYYVMVDGQEVSFDNYNDLVVYCKGLPSSNREFGFKYYGADGTTPYVRRFETTDFVNTCF